MLKILYNENVATFYNFFMIKIAEKPRQIMLYVKPFVIAKFKIIKGLKGLKKSEITSLREICH